MSTDEEDIAASVMGSLFRAAQQGRFPNLADRHELWRLLLRMTARKVVDLKRRESRQRRGGGRVQGESAFGGATWLANTRGWRRRSATCRRRNSPR